LNVWYHLVPRQEAEMAAKRALKPVPAANQIGTVRGRILEAAFAAFTQRGFAETSTLEIATRARVSKRELYALFGSKQEMLIACISERARRLKMPADLPELRDRDMLKRALSMFGAQLLRETSDRAVIAVFRLAIAEAVRAPEVAKMLNDVGIETSRGALRELMQRARSAGLLAGEAEILADHFAGLLWGNRMLGLLLDTAARPAAREIAARAEAASAAFLRAYPAPD
jgi:AcrR family transcriptional regulator